MAWRGSEVDVLFERVAGLDIGKATLTVCVPTPGPRGGRQAETRTFSTMTRSLQVMRDWLVERGVTIAAMESTSTYSEGRVLLPGGGAGGLAGQRRAHQGDLAAQDRREGRRVDRPGAGVRAAATVVRAAAGHPPVAHADSVSGAADGRPDPGDHPAGADARG